MSDLAIRVENLGKRYVIGGKQANYATLRDTIVDVAAAPFRRIGGVLRGESAAGLKEEIWALKDVSFEVKHGEVVGIIGRNGAGKSTLLKVLSRITEPTTGYADVYGRIGALLEVGTGFHAELTGRENIYLNGAILGMGREEIRRKFDEIVDFAGVEKFIDTPVKHYSSGMGLRLGFAVAAHLEPEILIVDEVLAVGDAEFQKKSMGKMSQVAGEGRTVLFVSHNMAAVQSMCTRAIWLASGQIMRDGDTDHTVQKYLSTSHALDARSAWANLNSISGDAIHVEAVAVVPHGETEVVSTSTEFSIRVDYRNAKPDLHLNLSVRLLNEQGILVFNTASLTERNWNGRPFMVGKYRSEFTIPANLLNDGQYSLDIMFVESASYEILRIDHAIAFEVVDSNYLRGTWNGKWPGAVRPALDWSTTLIEPEPNHIDASAT